MSGLFDAAGIGLIIVFLSYMLKEAGFKGWKLFSTLGIVALFFIAGSALGGFVDRLSDRFSSVGLSPLLQSVSKTVGGGYIFGICADICRDMGENGVANAVLVAGRVEIMLISLPYLDRILDISWELIGL